MPTHRYLATMISAAPMPTSTASSKPVAASCIASARALSTPRKDVTCTLRKIPRNGRIVALLPPGRRLIGDDSNIRTLRGNPHLSKSGSDQRVKPHCTHQRFRHQDRALVAKPLTVVREANGRISRVLLRHGLVDIREWGRKRIVIRLE